MCSLTSRAIAARHLNRTMRKIKERDFQLTCCTNRKMHQSYIPHCPYFVTEMSSGVCIAFKKWCITGCLFNALGDLWDGSICKWSNVISQSSSLCIFTRLYWIIIGTSRPLDDLVNSVTAEILMLVGFFLTLLGDTVMMAIITYFSAHCVSAC